MANGIYSMNYAERTQAKNAAHRQDMHWVKTGRKEYTNAYGIIIRYNHNRWIWDILLPTGQYVTSYSTLWAAKERVSYELEKATRQATAVTEAEKVVREAWNSL